MSGNPSFSSSMQPLSVGNVVSAGLIIYRDRFKSYYSLAFQAFLWTFIPVYGWAKSASILALISRLAFYEVIERPETIADARRKLEPKMWKFLGAQILSILIWIGLYLAFVLFLILLALIIGTLVSTLAKNNYLITFLAFLLIPTSAIVFLIVFLRIFSRLFVTEVALAVEENLSAFSAITRSWKLSEKSIGRLQLIVAVTFLITFPLLMLVYVIYGVKQLLFTLIPTDLQIAQTILFLVFIVFGNAANALLVPVWQAIKAVIYYDLRIRREGLGMEIRDSL